MGIYENNIELFEHNYAKERKKYKIVGAIRLLVFLGVIYSFYLSVRHGDFFYLYFSGSLVIVFLILLKLHSEYSWKMQYALALLEVNQKELDFVDNGISNFENGQEFLDPEHPYSFDLDIFGPKSLFEYLNRTASYIGKKKLSELLNLGVEVDQIQDNQDAIKELSQRVEYRQQINAFSQISSLDKKAYDQLKKWSQSPVVLLSKTTIVLAYVLPILLWISIGTYYFIDSILLGYLISTLFGINLIFSMSKTREIQNQLGGVEQLSKTINSYSLIIELIEKQNFSTTRMKQYLKAFTKDNTSASKKIKQLYGIFEKLETVHNLFIMVIFNGLGQYHIHVLQKLLKFKQKNASLLLDSIDKVGEIEALNSLANFSYNNRDYCFASMQSQSGMYFKDLGHPLLNKKNRVCNDISFQDQRFVILTGSNMSGKSTFLRSIGVNLVLAKMGAPICSTKANFLPLPLYVSMGVSDSLKDSESYFYAEVKRLHMIIENSHKTPSFVLLDEILRGTNSEDKQSGTIGVILKLIKEATYGLIATHDLEVCNITKDYPDVLSNKCFEVEIKNDDLYFDYKIRQGVCQNKNATFIMKKMHIID